MNRVVNIMLTALICIKCCYALPNDRHEIMVIRSDSSIYNYKTGLTTFTGHVKVDQGTTHLTAEKLTTKNNTRHQLEEAIAYGDTDLAHYWTLSNIGDTEMHAKAKIIKLHPTYSNVTLEKSVIVSHGTDHFHGELILYNRYEQTIIVPEKQNSQAILTFIPGKS